MLDALSLLLIAAAVAAVAWAALTAYRANESLSSSDEAASCDAMLEAHLRSSPVHLMSGALFDVANVDPTDLARILDALQRKRLLRPLADDNREVFKKLSAMVIDAIDAMPEKDVELLNTRSLYETNNQANIDRSRVREVGNALERTVGRLPVKEMERTIKESSMGRRLFERSRARGTESSSYEKGRYQNA